MNRIYAVRDKVAETFHAPYYAVNDGVAIRSFKAALNNPEHSFNQAKQDYELYTLGLFDEDCGQLLAEEDPVLIGTSEELIQWTDQQVDRHTMKQEMVEKGEVAEIDTRPQRRKNDA